MWWFNSHNCKAWWQDVCKGDSIGAPGAVSSPFSWTPPPRCLCLRVFQGHTPSFACTHTQISNVESFCEQRLIFSALLTPTVFQLSLCWVTHGCHLFKKPSAGIYSPTLCSTKSLPDWLHNGEGWVLEKLGGLKEKAKWHAYIPHTSFKAGNNIHLRPA